MQTDGNARFTSPVRRLKDGRTVTVVFVSAPSGEQRGDLSPSVVKHNNHAALAAAAAAAAAARLEPLTN